MPMPKRPKKSFIQFAVAAVIALVVGGIGILVAVFVISGMSAQSAQVAQQKDAEKQKLEAEVQRLKQEAQAKQTVAMKRLHEIRAAVRIPEGVRITPAMLVDIELEPGETPAEDSFSSVNQLAGQFSAEVIEQDASLTQDMLVDTAGMLPVTEGMRAISINVDKIGGVSGAISPGARVDVMVIFEDAKMSKTLLQNVRVIAVGGSFILPPAATSSTRGDDKNAPPPVTANPGAGITLEVTPEQAEMLALANKQGEFHLALRGFGDKKRKTLLGADMAQLISGTASVNFLPLPPRAPLPKLTAHPVAAQNPVNPAGLPAPGEAPPPEPVPKTFSLQILKGPSSETKEFEWSH
ncbi:MAG: Flp pilus assembly protein CpaB [Vampirovibrionales bacterium]|nr:Flp pilus assembly protein CpaB [Vampirovibrionales bacterium]